MHSDHNQLVFASHFTTARLVRYCTGPVLMMVLVSLYTIVDGYFVSNYAGATAFAAVNLIIPVLMILGGFGFMFGTGGSALTARIMGEGDLPQASRIFSMMVEATALLGLVISVLGIVWMPALARLLQASEDMLYDCVTYGRIILFFNVFFMLQNVFQAFMSAAEKPGFGFFVTLAAGAANMVLDWLFVAVFGWGVQGAAIATGLGQMTGSLIPLAYFALNRKGILHFSWTALKAGPLLQASLNGCSELVNNVSSSIVAIAFNFQLLRYLGEAGVAAYGVMMYVSMIFMAVAMGYAIGAAPIISYNYGAGNRRELQSLLKKSLFLNMLTGVIMYALAWVLARPLAVLFVGYDAALMNITIQGFHIFALLFLLSSLNIFFSAFFTALNNGLISALMSFSRTLVFSLLFVWILPAFFGTTGIWAAAAAAELGAFLLSAALLLYENRNYHYLPSRM